MILPATKYLLLVQKKVPGTCTRYKSKNLSIFHLRCCGTVFDANCKMSLPGRYIIDRMKRATGRYLKFPAPPYENPNYWEGVYKLMGPDDIFEWGFVSFAHFKEYQYKTYPLLPPFDSLQNNVGLDKHGVTTLRKTLGIVSRDEKSTNVTNDDDETILIIGCGNSKFGEELLEEGVSNGPIIQVDIASHAIESMNQRCAKYVESGVMRFVQDDATMLSAFNDNKIFATFDKGLLDALFCADSYEQCYDVLDSVHRVLKPGGKFCVLSKSRPEFLLERLLFKGVSNVHYKNNNPGIRVDHVQQQQGIKRIKNMWIDVNVQKLTGFFLYLFTKTPQSSARQSAQQRHRTRRM